MSSTYTVKTTAVTVTDLGPAATGSDLDRWSEIFEAELEANDSVTRYTDEGAEIDVIAEHEDQAREIVREMQNRAWDRFCSPA